MIVPDLKRKDGEWSQSAWVEGKAAMTRAGQYWVNLNERCKIGGSQQIQKPTYVGCKNMFKDFNKFCEWCQYQVGYGNEGWHLDKDILIKDNKIYSEETCVFVPKDINQLFTKSGISGKKSPYPQGVHKQKYGGFRVKLSKNGTQVWLGSFKTPEEAHDVYVAAKQEYVQNLAEKWKDQIDVRVYEKLIDFKVNK